MESSIDQHNDKENATRMEKSDQVVVIAVPLPAQGHLNQMLQLSCLISTYGVPVYFVGSAIHNHQVRHRANGLSPQDVARIHFHDIATPTFNSPPPNPNASNKFPVQLLPSFNATLSMREPFAAYLQEMTRKFRRVVVIHDPSTSVAVQDVASIDNAESYVLNCLSALFMASFSWKTAQREESNATEIWKALPSLKEITPPETSPEVVDFGALQVEKLEHRSGDIFNTCRLMEAPFLDMLEKGEHVGNRKLWAIGPILPTKITSANRSETDRQHKCLQWLDKQEKKSVIYISFGTTTALSNAEVKELGQGLENSKVKFLWVLRDADRANVFDGDVRRVELPEGFEERTKDMGIVVRDWAPQPEILAHPSIGGFMTHCGWNSCLESISMGVPMVACPMHSDQPMNAALITDILKTGLLVKEWDPRMPLVEASAVESALQILMTSEEGNEIRKRAEDLATTVQMATQHGGVSRLELDSFIAHITR